VSGHVNSNRRPKREYPSDRSLILHLKRYERTLRQADLEDQTVFQEVLQEASDLLNMKQENMAKEFQCANGTIDRWLRGVSTPHPVMRKVIYEKIIARCVRLQSRLGGL
jgi:ribosome-binding protein aMBF1 (putative translation factor)